MNRDNRIFVAGHRGLVGSAIERALRARGLENLLTRSRSELDLTSASETDRFFASERPDYVFLAAAKVGGIFANDRFSADFIRENLHIQCNVIEGCHKYGVKKLMFLGSTCIYPKHAPQPLKEEYLLTGPLEPTNDAYAVAKIAGITMVNAYRRQYGLHGISVMPTNLYGPGDNFAPENSHVLPALIRRFHEAKQQRVPAVTVWGSGTPRREFLYVDDLADACLFLMESYDKPEIVNIGVGDDISIRELAELVRDVVGYQGELVFDTSKPDGTPRKLVDVGRLNGLGWRAKTGLREGLERTYKWYLDNPAQVRG
ncbi:MAG: GDP-L-fucose synthase [Myxococcales bacterium]